MAYRNISMEPSHLPRLTISAVTTTTSKPRSLSDCAKPPRQSESFSTVRFTIGYFAEIPELTWRAGAHRVFKTGGCYVCVTPNRLWGPYDVSKYFDDVPRGLHLKEYSYRDLNGLFKGACFRRTAVLKGVNQPPKVASVSPYVAIESLLDLIPLRQRRGLMARTLGARATPPFSPLEQVVLAGWV